MEITIQHLLFLVAILFLANYIFQKKESFENSSETNKKDKACGQESINYGFLHYIFNSPKTPAR
jgi:hypothetical protein